MLYFARWKVILILAIAGLGVLYALPNLLGRETVTYLEQNVPSWLPGQTVNLGLDLQGGSHLLLEVEINTVIEERLESVVDSVRAELRQARIGYLGLGQDAGVVSFTVRDEGQINQAVAIVEDLDPELTVSAGEGGQIALALTEDAIETRRTAALDQSIEIIRRRIDETGTREPVIQRQGDSRIVVQLPGVDDPERMKRLLGETAKLTFHLLDENTSMNDALAGRVPPGSRVVPDADGSGQSYIIKRRVQVSGDTLVDAQTAFQDNQPVVSFRFDTVGARRFGETTQNNVGFRFAIVLDDEVISAPVIREPILGGSGVISGNFTVQSANDLALLLRAGALPAPLVILEERTVGPSLGADSVAAGEIASVVALVAVLVFMSLNYGLFGLFAAVALLLNISMIFALLSGLQATLTLPGIAGIVLTVGMAVDANVLIFERIREEIRKGRTPISAIEAGYGRAISTIVDSNVTTLIAAAFLFGLGSGPVKGFAVTLSIGILSSMFTAIMVTRLFVVTWLRRNRPAVIPL